MHPIVRSLLVVSFAWAALGAAETAKPAPQAVIFDTDMGGDCDDVGAQFMLHGAVERGEIRLLATMGCVSSDAIAPCLDGINAWFGRPEIPVGTLKDPGLLPDNGFPGELIRHYPHRFPSSAGYPDAVQLYREILAKQPDGSVMIVAVGPLRNIANLLRSKPDVASPLDGKALVAKKVKRLDVMGGKYPPWPSKSKEDGEYNFIKDAPSTALVCAEWPTPILFNGEGGSTMSGRRVTYEMAEHNPLTMAYRCYPAVGYAGDRNSWDPVSVLVAVRGPAPWYSIVRDGSNSADAANGVNQWLPGADRGHAYLVQDQKLPRREVEDALEDLMTAGQGHPRNLAFDMLFYADSGLCAVTGQGARTERGEWFDKAATTWLQYTYADGRKYRADSYAVSCREPQRAPRSVTLSGSNDNGKTWTVLDEQANPGFSAQDTRREFRIAKPGKWNAYRLALTTATPEEGILISGCSLIEAIDCPPKVEVASVTLDQPKLRLAADARATLVASLAPAATYERNVTWSSSDPTIAEVRRIGEQIAVVKALKAGTCTVTAIAGGKRQTCEVQVTASTLPAGWRCEELGSPAIPAAVSVAGQAFTITGCGHALSSWWSRTRDQGAFVSRAATPDDAIAIRVDSLSANAGGPSYQWDNRPPTATGVMIREPHAQSRGRFFAVQFTAQGTISVRWRDKTDDSDDSNHAELLNKESTKLPVHLKLVRAAAAVEVYTSTDGKIWGEPLMRHKAVYGQTSIIGMHVCSGNTFVSSTAALTLLPNSK